MARERIAILGATSHIAKGMIDRFVRQDRFTLHLFTRSTERLEVFLSSLTKFTPNMHTHEGYESFHCGRYDVIVNCVGVGTLRKHKGDYTLYFTVGESFDNLVLEYLKSVNPSALYIALSSGAIYGSAFEQPASPTSSTIIPINPIEQKDYYGITRLYSEAKHRAHSGFNIVDLRIFSYFSRYMDLADGYFIGDVIRAVLERKTFRTSPSPMVRDYVHPDDLFSLIIQCIQQRRINAAFDVVSAGPVEKKEILEFFASGYGLHYEEDPVFSQETATGTKQRYYSLENSAAAIGYEPRFSSMETIQSESEFILKCHSNAGVTVAPSSLAARDQRR